MVVRIPPHIRVRELSGRLRQAGLEIVHTPAGLDLRPRARLTIRRPIGHQAAANNNAKELS